MQIKSKTKPHSPSRLLDAISKVCNDYYARINRLEDEKYDLEYVVKGKDYQVHTLCKLHTFHIIFFN